MSDSGDKILKKMIKEMTGSNGDRNIYIIHGAPGSGKSTYVQKHKQSGDLVVDIDLIGSALQGNIAPHSDYSQILDIVIPVRETIYDCIKSHRGGWKNAYIITSNPNKQVVNMLADRMQAKVIDMKCDKATCIERIVKDNTRTDRQRDIGLAEKWFSN